MIKEIKVTNASGESMPMTLMSPDSSGLIVLGVDGLGPEKSTISLRANAMTSGSVFTAAKTPSRNIVLTLRFQETAMSLPASVKTIENTRLLTYRYFPTESRVRLDVTTDAGTYYIYGYVESNEVAIFAQYSGTVISIICPDPYFRTEDGLITGDITGINPMFSFPFANVGSGAALIFGMRIFMEEFSIPVPYGVVNVGPTLILRAVGGQVNCPRIFFRNPNDPTETYELGFVFNANLPPLEDGDYLEIVCERQNKSVTRFVAAAVNDEEPQFINYIGAVAYDSSWPVLRPGDNLFSYESDSPNIDAIITNVVDDDPDLDLSVRLFDAADAKTLAVTTVDSTDTVHATAHGLANGTPVTFATLVTTTGIVKNKLYYVVNAATDTFQVANTVGGARIVLTHNGSGTVTIFGNCAFKTSHGLSNGTPVAFSLILGTTGVVLDTTYYIVNATTDTFQVSATLGGSPIPLATDGTGTIGRVGNIVMDTAHGMENGTRIAFTTVVTTTGLSLNTEYFVANATPNTFQVSETQNGEPLPMTPNGTATYRKVGAGGAYIRFEYSYPLQYSGV